MNEHQNLIESLHARAEAAEARVRELERRVSDLKFALGDDAGWFDRFVAMRSRAKAAEARVRELEQELKVMTEDRDEWEYAHKDLIHSFLDPALARAEQAEQAERERDQALARVKELESELWAANMRIKDVQALELELSRYKYLETVSGGLMCTARELAELKRLVEDLKVGKYT